MVIATIAMGEVMKAGEDIRKGLEALAEALKFVVSEGLRAYLKDRK